MCQKAYKMQSFIHILCILKATWGTQDEIKQSKNTTQCMLDTLQSQEILNRPVFVLDILKSVSKF